MTRKPAIPHTYVIVFFFIAAAVVLTWILPGGEFDRELVDVNGTMREVIVEGSFHDAEKHPQTWQLFSALFDGFASKGVEDESGIEWRTNFLRMIGYKLGG